MGARNKRTYEGSATRSSKRLRGQSPESERSCVRMPHLPAEIKSTIAEYLEKCDLKSVRLVSKAWSVLVVPFLFDKVYISLRDYDLQVLTNIVTHPVLRRGPKELIWDASRFIPLQRPRAYFHHLMEVGRHGIWNMFEHSSDRFHEFLNDLWKCASSDAIYEEYQDDDFVKQGFELWTMHNGREQANLDSDFFYDTLRFALQQLNRLQAIAVYPELWEVIYRNDFFIESNTGRRIPSSGPPLMRSWDFRYAAPCDKHASNHSAHELQLLTAALANTKVQITELNFHNGNVTGSLEAGGLNLSMANEISELDAGVLTYRNLTSFDLTVFIHATDRFTQPGELLPYLLSSMNFLKELRVTTCSVGPMVGSEPPQLNCMCISIIIVKFLNLQFGLSKFLGYDASRIFRPDCQWRHLTIFSLIGTEIKGRNLLTLLAFQMPALRELRLADIDLTDWCWESVFEGLMAYGNIEWIDLPFRPNGLWHHDGEFYIPAGLLDPNRGGEFRQVKKYHEDISNYVLYGGRHPSLPADADARDADRYLDDYHDEKFECEAKFTRYRRAWGLPDNTILSQEERSLALSH